MDTNCTKNAIIIGTFLGIDDHETLVLRINLNYGDGHQGYGNFGIDSLPCNVLHRILDTVGEQSWEKLLGKVCRVKIDEKGWAREIGHFIEDKWYDLSAEARRLEV